MKDFSVRKGYTISCYYELPKLFIPYAAPFWLRGSHFLLGDLSQKYQVVSVLPSVAPSRHLTFRGAPWMHGYERLEKCEAGEVRPRSEITWLSWRSWQDRPELGTHASKDEQESHRDVIGKFAYRLKFAPFEFISNRGVELKCGSCVTRNQLWEILIWVGAHYRINLFNSRCN